MTTAMMSARDFYVHGTRWDFTDNDKMDALRDRQATDFDAYVANKIRRAAEQYVLNAADKVAVLAYADRVEKGLELA